MKTPLILMLKNALKLAQYANQTNAPAADELADMYVDGYTRRSFLKQSAKAGLLFGASSLFPSLSFATPPNVRIAIIGGGIAGLSAAHYLKKAGIQSFTIYEADKRLGGRILTKKDIIHKNLRTEIGGEYIDSYHKDMFKLVKDYGLSMIDTFKEPLPLKKDAFFFEGKHIELKQVIAEYQGIINKIRKDKGSLDADLTNIDAQKLDNTSLAEYLEGLEASTWFNKLLNTAYLAEYGLDTAEQSSLNFINMIDTETPSAFNMYGESDERYKIKGGNNLLIDMMANAMGNYVQTEMKLTAIYSVGKKFLMTFNERMNIEADIVIMTLPFTVLRDIEIQVDGMTEEKRQCIMELGYGTNAKVMMGFNKRIWREKGYQGYLFNETIHNGWDNGLFQNAAQNNALEGGYTVFLGGADGLEVQRGFEQDSETKYLAELNKVFPGIDKDYNNRIVLGDWPQNPFVKASYACYKVGQWTTISGLEGEQIGNLYFAGEHCSEDSQGYMNGGAETGRVVAQNIVKLLKAKQ